MSQYFLLKEQIYTDGAVEKKHTSLIEDGKISYNTYDKALEETKKIILRPDDIIYIVEVAGKRFGNLKLIKE